MTKQFNFSPDCAFLCLFTVLNARRRSFEYFFFMFISRLKDEDYFYLSFFFIY